jgi:hypothetical protein
MKIVYLLPLSLPSSHMSATSFTLKKGRILRLLLTTVCGASKIKLKKVNKKRMVTLGRVIIVFEYLKASIADLITLLSSSVQNPEGDGGDSCALGVSSGLPLV